MHRNVGLRCWPKSDQTTSRSTGFDVCMRPERASPSSASCYCTPCSPIIEDDSRYVVGVYLIFNESADVPLDRLLNLLSVILGGQKYKPLGAPSTMRSDSAPMTREFSNNEVGYPRLPKCSFVTCTTQTAASAKTPEMLTLALTILGTFDFSGTHGGPVFSAHTHQVYRPYSQ